MNTLANEHDVDTHVAQLADRVADASENESASTMADQIARHLLAVGLSRGLIHEQIVSALMATFAEVRAEINAGSTGGAR